MSNKIVLYHLYLSPPVRTVKIVAKLLGLDLELREIDLLNKEHYKEPFTKLNPERTIPTLVDGDFVIWDSHAICSYLVDKYGNDDKLYPKDLQLRAKCNQRLFFDASSLFVRLRDISLTIFFKGGSDIPQDKVDLIYTAYEILEAFLASDSFLVGNNLTIADISVSVSVLPLEVYAPLKSDKHPKILAWLNRIKQTIPFYDEINAKPVEDFRKLLQNTIATNKQNK